MIVRNDYFYEYDINIIKQTPLILNDRKIVYCIYEDH